MTIGNAGGNGRPRKEHKAEFTSIRVRKLTLEEKQVMYTALTPEERAEALLTAARQKRSAAA